MFRYSPLLIVLSASKAFSRAASDGEESDVALIRLEDLNGDLRAVEYSEEELRIATNQHIEVR